MQNKLRLFLLKSAGKKIKKDHDAVMPWGGAHPRRPSPERPEIHRLGGVLEPDAEGYGEHGKIAEFRIGIPRLGAITKMSIPVDLGGEFDSRTVEVDEIRADTVLPAKLEPA